jgi:amidohydrolase
MPSPQEVAGLVEQVTPKAVELRRLLHRYPEPSYHEHQTTALIATTLDQHGIDHHLRAPATGLWLDIGPDPVAGFRADIDALPITEPEINAPRSQNEGWMHACGHDAHAAIAAGIAIVMNRLRLERGVRVLFQPAEEAYPGGASEMVAEGLVDGIKSLLAFHVDPALAVGRIGAKVGPVTGSSDLLVITLSGPGGHTSRPHRTVDLVDAAARVVNELPGLIRQSIDSRIAVTTVFGSIHGGEAANVIPTEVVLKGTVRTLDKSLWDVLPGLVDKALSGLLAVSSAGYRLDYRQGIPPVVNDHRVVDTACEGIVAHLGESAVVETETSMGGEDFSNYLGVTPGALLRLGAESGGGDLHSAGFNVNEAAVGVGIRAGTAALLSLMERA